MAIELGANQGFKLSTVKEAVYGTENNGAVYAALGVVTGGEMGQKFDTQRVFGIGSSTAQLIYAGRLDSTVRVELSVPTKDAMIPAYDRTGGDLDSFSFEVGDAVTGWKGVGLKWNSMSIELDTDNPLKCTLEGMFKEIIGLHNVAVGAHSVVNPSIWQASGVTIKYGASGATVEDADAIAFTINVNNNLELKPTANKGAGSVRIPKYLREGDQVIDCTLQTYTPFAVDLEADCPGKTIELTAKFVDLCDGTKDMLITLTGGTYVERRMPLKPNDYIDYSIGIQFSAIEITDPA